MKKLWCWIFSIMGVVTLFFALSFSVFSLNNVSLKFHNATTKFTSEESKTEIIQTANFNYNSSVLFLDKQSKISKLEKTYPYLKIINMETIFPNTIKIHAVEREAVFNIPFTNGYYVCDSNLKVLAVETETFVSTQNNNILLTNLTNLPNNLVAGSFINIKGIKTLQNISPALELNNRNICMQKSLIKEIKIINSHNTTGTILEITDFNNLKTQIADAINKLPEKFSLMFYKVSMGVNPTTHYLYIYKALNGDILCETRAFA